MSAFINSGHSTSTILGNPTVRFRPEADTHNPESLEALEMLLGRHQPGLRQTNTFSAHAGATVLEEIIGNDLEQMVRPALRERFGQFDRVREVRDKNSLEQSLDRLRMGRGNIQLFVGAKTQLVPICGSEASPTVEYRRLHMRHAGINKYPDTVLKHCVHG